jgi:hypothetical protein
MSSISVLLLLLLILHNIFSTNAILYHGVFDLPPNTFKMIDYFHCNFFESRLVDIDLVWLSANRSDLVYFKTIDTSDSYTNFIFGPSNLFLAKGSFTVAKYGSEAKYPPAFGLFNGNENRNAIVDFQLNVNCTITK